MDEQMFTFDDDETKKLNYISLFQALNWHKQYQY